MLKRTLALIAAAASAEARTTWEQLSESYTYAAWLAEHGAKFPGSEAAFKANLAEILAHNADSTQTWKKGVNQFTGMTKAEFKDFVGHGYAPRGASSKKAHVGATPADLSAHVPTSALPASLDWRTATPAVVGPVKDQGGCGGCWAFSTTEAIESHIAIKTGKLFALSPQEVLACTLNPNQCGGTGGCSGATQELGFNSTVYNGITTEAIWPYRGNSGTCTPGLVAQKVATIAGYEALPFNNYTALMNAVVNVGPISISAAAEPWQSYESGVFSSNCGSDVDHAIVLDGYGTDAASGLDYYLVRNSWSAGWGEKGYIRVARYGDKKAEPCLTDNTPGDGDGCSDGPASIQVCGLCGILSDSSYPTGGALAAAHVPLAMVGGSPY